MRVSEGLGRGPMVEKVKVPPPSSLLPVLRRWLLAPVPGESPKGAAAGTELTPLKIS